MIPIDLAMKPKTEWPVAAARTGPRWEPSALQLVIRMRKVAEM